MAATQAGSERLSTADATVFGLIDVDASRWMYRLLRLIVFPVMRMLFRIEIEGRANVPAAGPFVVAANHLGWLDAPLLVLGFPLVPRINFVADATFVSESTWRWFVGRLMGGVLPLVTHGHGLPPASRVIQACLAGGGSVGFFPEGRYGESEDQVLRFHRGFAKAAIEAGVPVVPVRVSGTKDVWLRKRVRVAIGTPIEATGQTADGLAAVTHDRIAGMAPVRSVDAGPRLFRRLLTRLFP
ncbi:MAG TPA: lysophospholipid acyltransferase family protein [Candidatus Dormibacteraeota bacterium]|nr:lysophospholipid acyltransferase family protein [Candidatus Dormibacteraeota bacterium]